RSFSTTPEAKHSTSINPLSVSISAMISPRSILSPGFFIQAMSLPASISAPSAGITNSAMSHHLLYSFYYLAGLWQCGVFKVFRVRHRRLFAAYARDRRVEFIEGVLH